MRHHGFRCILERVRGSLAVGIPVVLLLVSGCQRVGVEAGPGEPPSPQDAAPTLPMTPPIGNSQLELDPPTRRPEIDSREFDPILLSHAAQDARVREQIEFWVDFGTSRGSGHFGRYLERMGRYSILVDTELDRRGLPRTLRYLPIVESGYLPAAVSRVGATGMWQIMAPTARSLGLKVDALVDDRRDPVASTFAALDYLEQLHRQFDSWFLALAAYNAGPGRINGILQRYAPDATLPGDVRYLLVRAHLPAETREFVPKLFAASELARNPEAYGLGAPSVTEPMAFDQVWVPDATSLDVVAWAAGADHDEVLALNPHFLRGFTPVGEERVVRVPAGTSANFEVNYALIPPSERISFLEHVVARGETLSHIAGRYGIRLAELTAANGNLDPRRLQIGQRLVVPVAGRTERTPFPPAIIAPAQGAGDRLDEGG